MSDDETMQQVTGAVAGAGAVGGETTGDQQTQAQIWGIKTPQMQLHEATQIRAVDERTLLIIQNSVPDIMRRGRRVELERTRSRMEQYVASLKGDNERITQFMIETGHSVEEVAQLNYDNEMQMDTFQDTMEEISNRLSEIDKRVQKEQTIEVKEERTMDFKTPKLQLRKYSGDPLKWMEFWEQYRFAVHDRKMQPSAKMVQLRELLVGRAAAVIRGLPLSDANYDVAINRLHKEFGDDSNLRSAHIKAIRDIQPINNAANLVKLRRFYEDVATNYAALESLGFATHVLCLVEETVMKLPRSIRFEITKNEPMWTRWNFEQMLEKLWSYLKACEDIEPTTKSEKSILNTTTNRNFRPTGTNCVYCSNNTHKSFECQQVSTVKDRIAILKRDKRCFNCTRVGHSVKECRSRNTCYHCRGKHHSSICQKQDNGTKEEEQTVNSAPGMHIKSGAVAYQTVQAKIGDHQCRVLLDSGSGGSYISREHGRKLNVRPVRTEHRVIGTVNGDMEVSCPIYKLRVDAVGKSRESFVTEFAQLDLFMLSSIPNSHPEIQKRNYPHLRNLWFSDVSKDKTLQIHAIIGAKDFAKIKTGAIVRGNKNEPIAEETTLGWTLMGSLGDSTQEAESITYLMMDKPGSINGELKHLWDLDVLGVKDGSEDVYESFADNISQDSSGRYTVKLPWRKGQFYLPDNKKLSETRLRSQFKKLKRTPEILEQYDAIVKEQLREGIVEPVPEKPDGQRVSYIPHHPVIRSDAETTKLRIVYDASAKDRKYNNSLNDCLHIGPSLLPLLFDILLRFRLYPVVILGDIQKAFLQIQVDKKDRDCLRFLWYENVKEEHPVMRELRFTRVIFGSGPSPFLLNATIREHMKQYAENDPDFVRQVVKSLYVDDYVGGCDTVEQAIKLKKKLAERFQEGKFNMRKWKTNNATLRKEVEEGSKYDADETAREQNQIQDSKVLGVLWRPDDDKIGVDFRKLLAVKHEPTQRGMLRSISTIFDPLGIASPVSITGKIIYHEVCLQKQGWDDEISSELAKRWNMWTKEVAAHPVICTDRCMLSETSGELTDITIHGFSDSSVAACCAMVYLVVNQNGIRTTKLLTAKSRVAKPDLSVPRLELVGAQLLTRLVKTVHAALEGWTISETHCWTDSKTVLCWLANKGEWKQFVRSRVNQILAEDYISWRYCPTSENPVDIGTRGMTPERLQTCEPWWQGPQWLQEKELWPDSENVTDDQQANEERRESNLVSVINENGAGLTRVFDLSRYASAKKLFRISAYVLRFLKVCRKEEAQRSQTLSTNEILEAERVWIRHAQSAHQATVNQKRQLGIQVDEQNIQICHGRFDIPATEQPIYLPKQDSLVPLIIADAHRRALHMGVASTLAEVRGRYWIPNGRQMVKKIVHNCQHCRRYRVKAMKAPETAALPAFRISQGYPFQSTGVDFAGPIYYKRGKKERKSYITLFTCATSRAVHLELVEDMTAATFRRSLKNLITRRGTPEMIVSDNAKTFQSTAKWLKSIRKDNKTQSLLNDLGITWRFNLSRSPWWGGFFERMVGLVKNSAKKSMGRAKLTFPELTELMLDVEFALNNRPLTYQGDDLEMEPLTPNHLIHGRRLKPFDTGAIISDEETTPAKKRLRYLNRMKEHY